MKFRGQRVDNKEFVYGDLMTKYIHHSNSTIVESGCIYHEVFIETVGRFIGVTEKNNKELYEGDIIKHNGTLFRVKWSVTQLGFVCVDWKHKTHGGWFNWRSGEWMVRVRKYIELVGNIHANPELLEKTK